MPELLVGPLLRYVGPEEATVFVETSAPGTVEILGSEAPTFCVAGHFYALVHVTGLEPGTAHGYGVRLDGELLWPERGSRFPEAVIRTPDPPAGGTPRERRIVFGSCRVSAPHERPYTLGREKDARGLGVDALHATAVRLADRLGREGPDALPDLLVLLGDQVYAHKPPFATQEFIRSRRDPDGSGAGEVALDFEEYARLYRDTWSEASVRWLLSSVPSAMIFDDHEFEDDWNISDSWLDEARQRPWWNEQVAGGYASYWLYQHLGNLSPEELESDSLYREVRAAPDGWPLLAEFAYKTHRTARGTRWSYARDLGVPEGGSGGVRLVMIDSRGSRELAEGEREIIDRDTEEWLRENAAGGFDHLLLGTSVPFLLGPAMHRLQTLTEALSGGRGGSRLAALAERLRRSQDLDHWASFRRSFLFLADTLRAVAAGERGEAPATVVVLSGDVHHGYLAEATFTDDRPERPESRVYQAVSSPLRNALPERKSRLQRLAWIEPLALVAGLLSRLAGVGREPLLWRLAHEKVWFENQVATLCLSGRRASVTFERAATDESGEPTLEKVFTARLD